VGKNRNVSWKGGVVEIEYIDVRTGTIEVEIVGPGKALTMQEVAQVMGVSRVAVAKWVTKNGLPVNRWKNGKLVFYTVNVADLRKFATERGFFVGGGE
jgi:hypothetical protein